MEERKMLVEKINRAMEKAGMKTLRRIYRILLALMEHE